MFKQLLISLGLVFLLAACATSRVPAAYVVYIPPEARMSGKYAVVYPTNQHTEARLVTGEACHAFATGETVTSAVQRSLDIVMKQLVDEHVVVTAPLTQKQLVAGGYAGMFIFDGTGEATSHLPPDIPMSFELFPEMTAIVDTAVMSQVVGVDGAVYPFLLLGRGIGGAPIRSSCDRSEMALNHAFMHALEGFMGSAFNIIVNGQEFKAFKDRNKKKAQDL